MTIVILLKTSALLVIVTTAGLILEVRYCAFTRLFPRQRLPFPGTRHAAGQTTLISECSLPRLARPAAPHRLGPRNPPPATFSPAPAALRHAIRPYLSTRSAQPASLAPRRTKRTQSHFRTVRCPHLWHCAYPHFGFAPQFPITISATRYAASRKPPENAGRTCFACTLHARIARFLNNFPARAPPGERQL